MIAPRGAATQQHAEVPAQSTLTVIKDKLRALLRLPCADFLVHFGPEGLIWFIGDNEYAF